jgi:hypothetical protein
LRYLQAQFIQSAQTTGCNARYTVEQRLARWLLLCADRNGNRVLPLSHEYMADMLGSRRSPVTTVAGEFKARKLIDYTRNNIQLLDLEGLEKMACECYRVVREHLTNLTKYDPARTHRLLDQDHRSNLRSSSTIRLWHATDTRVFWRAFGGVHCKRTAVKTIWAVDAV